MFTAHTRRVPLRRRLVAGGGSSGVVLALLGLFSAPPDAPTPDDEVAPVDAVLVLYDALPAPPPHVPPPARTGGGGRTGAAPQPAAAATVEAPDDPVPLDRAALLDAVDLSSLGRQTADGGGVGAGAGGLLGAGLGHGPDGPPTLTTTLRVLEQVHPRFPPRARQYGDEAVCDLLFTITQAGLPEAIEVTGCPTVFRSAVEEAALQWRFDPPRIRGMPSAVRYKVRVRFVLR